MTSFASCYSNWLNEIVLFFSNQNYSLQQNIQRVVHLTNNRAKRKLPMRELETYSCTMQNVNLFLSILSCFYVVNRGIIYLLLHRGRTESSKVTPSRQTIWQNLCQAKWWSDLVPRWAVHIYTHGAVSAPPNSEQSHLGLNCVCVYHGAKTQQDRQHVEK